jgi:hypothetical protein
MGVSESLKNFQEISGNLEVTSFLRLFKNSKT